jgi:hypothetical protein
MEHPMILSAGRKHEIADVKIVALYEVQTGNIVHLHTVVAFKGGRVLSEKEVIDEAQRQASHRGHATGRLATKVSSNLEHAARPHRIDPASGQFVPLSFIDQQEKRS